MALRRRTVVGLVASIAGVALLVWQIRAAGPAAIADRLSQVGWWFVAILTLSFGRLLLRSIAWRALMGNAAPLGRTLAATMGGDAIGNLSFLNLLISEPAKAAYIGRDVGTERAFAALTAENFFYSVSVAVYILIGTAAMLYAFQGHLAEPVVWSGVAALALMAVILAGAGWMAVARPAIASEVVRRVPIARVSKWADRVKQFEALTYGSAGSSGGLTVALAAQIGFHVLSFAETWLTLWLLAGAADSLAAFILDTANRIVNVVFRFVPMRAGVDEITSETVASSIGLGTGIGTAMGLVRKARVLTWAGVGLAIWLRRVLP